MADLQISDLPVAPIVTGTDVVALEDAATTTYKATLDAISQFVQTSLSSPPQIVYVSPNGVDAIANGDFYEPYLTLPYALSQITDATTAKPYKIIVTKSNYTFGATALKPNIEIDFDGSDIDFTGNVTLDASWNLQPNSFLNVHNANILKFSTSADFDFNAVSAINANFILYDITRLDAGSFNAKGNIANVTNISFRNIKTTTIPTGMTVQQADGVAINIDTNIFQVNTTNPALHNYQVFGCSIGTVIAQASTGTLVSYVTSNLITNLEVRGIGGGSSQCYSNNNNIANSPIVDGLGTFLIIDRIIQLPTLINNGNVTYSTISNGMTANYISTNYTPITAQIPGHLEGIDNALGAIPPNTLNNAYEGGNFINIANNLPVQVNVDNVVAAIQRISSAVGSDNQLIDVLKFTGNNDGGTPYDYVDIEIRQRLNLTAPLNIDSASVSFYLLENAVKTLYYILDAGNRYIQFYKDTQFINANMTLQRNTTATPDWRFYSNVTGTLNQIVAQISSRSLDDGDTLKTVNSLRITTSDPAAATFSQKVTMQAYSNNAVKNIFDFNGTDNSTLIINSTSGLPDQAATLNDISTFSASVITIATMIDPNFSTVLNTWRTLVLTYNGVNFLPANTLVAGDNIVYKAQGYTDSVSTAANFTFRVLFGGAVLGTGFSFSDNNGPNQRAWELTFTISIVTANTFRFDVTGWVESFTNVLQPLRFYPASLPAAFNPAVDNTIDVEAFLTGGGGASYTPVPLTVIIQKNNAAA